MGNKGAVTSGEREGVGTKTIRYKISLDNMGNIANRLSF